MNLALFDFDNTLTSADCFSVFIYRHINTKKPSLRLMRLGIAKILYGWGLYPVAKLRQQASYITFHGKSVEAVRQDAERFMHEFINRHLRQEGLEKLKWHQTRGDKVVVVSASIDPYLKLWCAARGVDLLCSELAIDGGQYTGRYQHGDCGGDNKAKRVRAKYDLTLFDEIYAYGDSQDDLPMLALATKAYMNWQLLD